jgi:hypothetical protein
MHTLLLCVCARRMGTSWQMGCSSPSATYTDSRPVCITVSAASDCLPAFPVACRAMAPVVPPNVGLKLFGGAAFERCLHEFHFPAGMRWAGPARAAGGWSCLWAVGGWGCLDGAGEECRC